jgi:hypothetical protein
MNGPAGKAQSIFPNSPWIVSLHGKTSGAFVTDSGPNRIREHVRAWRGYKVDEEETLGADLELIAEAKQAISNFDVVIEAQRSLVSALGRGHDNAAREARGQG